ncbi:MAG: hypothetical protein AAB685_01070 [Patescibacteria group bacterium]
MSKIFYDHLISFTEIEVQIDRVAVNKEEKEEMWHLVDEIIHHKVLGCILDSLSKKDHQAFLEKFHATPHDESLLEYLKEKVSDIEDKIKLELKKLSKSILKEIS